MFLTHTPVHYLCLPDDGSPLCKQMLSSFSTSIAPGTLVNRRKQAEEYVRFSLLYNVPYLHPSITQVCMYSQYLANKFAAPASIKNYLSGAKTWVGEHRGSVHSFLAPQLAQLVKGFVKNSSHVTVRAPPLLPHHIRHICSVLDVSPSAPLALKPALLIGYDCFLRASNLLSPTMLEWGGPHTLLAADIKVTLSGLQVLVRSTKTRPASAACSFYIPRGDFPQFCPVEAWIHYKQTVRPWALGPAFVHINRQPLTPAQVVKILRLALKDHVDICAARVSMHSLRRGATQAAADKGISLHEIQARGTWASPTGMRPYLKSDSTSVKTILASNLAT